MTVVEPEWGDDPQRTNDRIAAAATRANTHRKPTAMQWRLQYEIPAETAGWLYAGDPGGLALAHCWYDQFPGQECAVTVRRQPTHPQDETPDCFDVEYVADVSRPAASSDRLHRIEGEPYKTPLYTQRRLFWEAVEWAIEWMDEHPAQEYEHGE